MPPLVSVVVPVLEEAAVLPCLLDHLAALPGTFETIVVDGGSTDGTAAVVRSHPLAPTLLVTGAGRAEQLNTGARHARGEVLLFLHADTLLPRDAHAQLAAAWRGGVAGGNFRLRFDGDDAAARLLALVYAFQRRLGVYYGDSALWARADVFRRLGGFRALPILDDYDFARRLERNARTSCLAGPVVTSGRRWRRLGLARTITTWLTIQALYLVGVPAERLARLYAPVR